MSKKPKPPAKITAEIESTCTCALYDWPEHQCPFAREIYEDPEFVCTCCPYCTDQCRGDI